MTKELTELCQRVVIQEDKARTAAHECEGFKFKKPYEKQQIAERRFENWWKEEGHEMFIGTGLMDTMKRACRMDWMESSLTRELRSR